MKISLILLMLIASWTALGKDNCEALKKKYQQDLKKLDYSCKIDSDCTEASLKYNSCAGSVGIAKSNSKIKIDKLLNRLKLVRKTCQYIHPPCPDLTKEAYCNKGRCSERFPRIDKSNDPKSLKDTP